jgi:hypothetical protein
MKASILRLIVAFAASLPTMADADAPTGRYVVTAGGTGNGTVYDTKSKLTWQQTVLSTSTWANAKTYCLGVGGTLGGTGWRLPTVKELMSIVDYSKSTAPLIDPSAFPATPVGWFWSSSPVAGSSSNAWYLDFRNGYVSSDPVSNPSNNVRCVR